MHNAFPVRGIECVRNSERQHEQRVHIHGLARDGVFQRLPFEQLHDDKGATALFTYFVNRADIRMVKRRRRERLALKSFQHHCIMDHIFRQEFQSDMAVKFEVFRFIHHAHSAAPEFVQHAVVRDGLADHEERLIL